MLAPRYQQWKSILQMTEMLQQLSVGENWQKIIELEAERFCKIEDFFSTPVLESEVDEVGEGIRQMIKSDELLKQHSVTQQQNMFDDIKKISTGRKAIKEYGRIQK